VRFLADTGISLTTIADLPRSGRDALRLREIGQITMRDHEIVAGKQDSVPDPNPVT
jgi:hypothetical protein